ncbi:hypothetical protein GCM10017784_12130 [Deinococcus indicus]|nr:hypothetical protein GCM10017784_12130 [Deinococcus indicus]
MGLEARWPSLVTVVIRHRSRPRILRASWVIFWSGMPVTLRGGVGWAGAAGFMEWTRGAQRSFMRAGGQEGGG